MSAGGELPVPGWTGDEAAVLRKMDTEASRSALAEWYWGGQPEEVRRCETVLGGMRRCPHRASVAVTTGCTAAEHVGDDVLCWCCAGELNEAARTGHVHCRCCGAPSVVLKAEPLPGCELESGELAG